MDNVEIERKWMVKSWPDGLKAFSEELQRQGYISTSPTVRIREEREAGDEATRYILCIKNGSGLMRVEVEFEMDKNKFDILLSTLPMPPIEKIRRKYRLGNGRVLEVNRVYTGEDSDTMYAEIEFQSQQEAVNYNPSEDGLEDFLKCEVTYKSEYSMAAIWKKLLDKRNVVK